MVLILGFVATALTLCIAGITFAAVTRYGVRAEIIPGARHLMETMGLFSAIIFYLVSINGMIWGSVFFTVD